MLPYGIGMYKDGTRGNNCMRGKNVRGVKNSSKFTPQRKIRGGKRESYVILHGL